MSDLSTPDILEAVTHQAGLMVATVYLIQFLKRAQWFPWINANSERLTQWVSTLAALGSAIFIQGTLTMTGSASDGWHFSGTIPSVHVLFDAFVRFAGQKAGQEFLFRNVVERPKEVTIVPPVKMTPDGKPAEDNLVVKP